MKFVGVHGIRSDGHLNIDLLLDEMSRKGHKVKDVQTPSRSTWEARFKSRMDGQQVANVSEDGDVLLAHSYGCLVASEAMKLVKYKAVYLFRPAMSRKYKFQASPTKIYCIYSIADKAIWLGGFLRFNHPFGLAGVFGFRSDRVTNLMSKGHHGSDFEPETVESWADFIEWSET
jgi:hypothetical protein